MPGIRYTFIVCILFLNNVLIFSQQVKTGEQIFKFTATVTDSLTNQPIPFCSVSLLSQPGGKFVKGTTTDENGVFNFNNLTSVNYSIRFNSIGYNEKYYNLNVENTNDVHLKFALSPARVELKDVVVQAHKPLYRQEADRKIYLVENDPIIQSSFGIDALQNAPGVNVDLSGAISMRGSSVSILINGQKTNKTAELLKMYLDQLPASNIEKIEVISNPNAKFSATNTNGIINIVLKKDFTNNQLFCIGTVISNRPTYGVWTSYVFNKPKWSINLRYLVSSTSDHRDDFKESWANQDENVFHNRFEQSTRNHSLNNQIDADFSYKISTKSSFSLSSGGIWNKGDHKIENSLLYDYHKSSNIQNVISNKEKLSDFYNSFVFNHKFNNKGHNLSISINNEIYEANPAKTKKQNITNTGQSKILYSLERNRNLSSNIRVDYSLPLNNGYEFETGLFYDPLTKNKDYRQVDTFSNIIGIRYNCDLLNKNNTIQTPKVEYYITFSGKLLKLKYKVGIRLEESSAIIKNMTPEFLMDKKFYGAHPSLNILYETTNKHNFSLSYSSRIIKPYNEMNPYIDMIEESYVTKGNPNLKLARTNSYEFGYFKDFNSTILVNLSIYHRTTNNNITQVNDLTYIGLYNTFVLQQTYENIVNTKFSGISTNLSYQLNKNIRLKIDGDIFYRSIENIPNYYLGKSTSSYYVVKGNTTIKLAKSHQIMIVLNYKSKDDQLLNKTEDVFTTSIYTRSEFLNNRLNIALLARNLFIKSLSVNVYEDQYSYIYSKSVYISPIFQCIVLWKFGNRSFERQANINRFIN